jgi:UDP-N-acetylglucosamine 3-dehydrogenase
VVNVLKVGVVGVGAMGKNHARVYSTLPGCELVGVADLNEKSARSIAGTYSTKAFTDYKKLVGEGVEAVTIAVPTSLHAEVASYFLKKGIHCLIEKPIASNVEDGRRIIREAKENKVKLMVGHIERFNPAVQKTKEIIADGLLGKILIISSRRVGPFAPRIIDVGIIIDLATHDIDIARYFYGKEPVAVYSKFGSIKHKEEDHAIMLLDFGNGSASIEVNWFTPHKVRTAVITGTEGIAYVDYIEQQVTLFNAQWKMEPKVEKGEPLKAELENFVDCIREDKEPLVSGEEGLKTLKVALEVLESHRVEN